jgi:hypothetical protein
MKTQQSTNIVIEQLRLMALDTLKKGNFQELAASISSNMESKSIISKTKCDYCSRFNKQGRIIARNGPKHKRFFAKGTYYGFKIRIC